MNTATDGNDDGAEMRAVMGDYFDALLHDSSGPHPQTIAVQAVTIPAEIVAVAPGPATVVSDAGCSDTTAQAADPELETVAETERAEHAAIPSYQLIRIGGLTLAIPTHAIAETVTAAPQWMPLTDARAWVLGSHRGKTESYTVVDTAALLVPGGALQAGAVGGSVVLLAGQRWALACDGIGERITPDPAQVTWRGAQGKRPWLAGTLSAPTCALLDIPELLRLLEAG